MTPEQIIRALEIPLVVGGVEPPRGTQIGFPPTGWSCLYQECNGPLTVWASKASVGCLIGAIHEALHAIIGPDSLDEELESGLMALEWGVCQERLRSIRRRRR